MPVFPTLWEAEAGRLLWAQEFETILCNMAKPLQYKKHKKISKACWHMPIVPATPATWEAEAGGPPEPGKVEAALKRDCSTALQPG